jgi:hypothetical protein
VESSFSLLRNLLGHLLEAVSQILKLKRRPETPTRLLDLARALRYLPIVAIVLAGTALLPSFPPLFLIAFTPLYPSSISLLGVVLVFVLLLISRRIVHERAPSDRVQRARYIPSESTYDMMVCDALVQQGASELRREVVLRGARAPHRLDFLFKDNGKTYVAEAKTRPLLPSDIGNARLVLEDLRSGMTQIDGILLFTGEDPSTAVLKMAKSQGVDVLVLRRGEIHTAP